MTHWFTADPHFGHENIIRLCKRPFMNVAEMDQVLIENINKKVQTGDSLYILGDFCWGSISDAKHYRSLIKCDNIYYIWGNHDKKLRASPTDAKRLFKEFTPYMELTLNGQYIILFHYPITEWDCFFRGSWQLFGHVHGNLTPPPGHLSCDVGVDVHNYSPISFEELRIIMENRRSFNSKSIGDFKKEG